jgi:integrase/recombinase XerC
MSPEQLKAGLAAAKAAGPMPYALASIVSQHGLRANELAGIRMADLNLRERSMRVTPGKGSVSTVEQLKPSTVEAIQSWLAVKPDSEYLFPQTRDTSRPLSRVQVYQIFVSIAEKAGIPAVSRAPHAWRHSLGAILTDNGVPLATTQRVLRHKSIASTIFYTHVGEKQAAQARDKFLNWEVA